MAKAKCDACDKEFNNEWGLKVHMNRVHKFKPKHAHRKATIVQHHINYCPGCGFPLALLQVRS